MHVCIYYRQHTSYHPPPHSPNPQMRMYKDANEKDEKNQTQEPHPKREDSSLLLLLLLFCSPPPPTHPPTYSSSSNASPPKVFSPE